MSNKQKLKNVEVDLSLALVVISHWKAAVVSFKPLIKGVGATFLPQLRQMDRGPQVCFMFWPGMHSGQQNMDHLALVNLEDGWMDGWSDGRV